MISQWLRAWLPGPVDLAEAWHEMRWRDDPVWLVVVGTALLGLASPWPALLPVLPLVLASYLFVRVRYEARRDQTSLVVAPMCLALASFAESAHALHGGAVRLGTAMLSAPLAGLAVAFIVVGRRSWAAPSGWATMVVLRAFLPVVVGGVVVSVGVVVARLALHRPTWRLEAAWATCAMLGLGLAWVVSRMHRASLSRLGDPARWVPHHHGVAVPLDADSSMHPYRVAPRLDVRSPAHILRAAVDEVTWRSVAGPMVIVMLAGAPVVAAASPPPAPRDPRLTTSAQPVRARAQASSPFASAAAATSASSPPLAASAR